MADGLNGSAIELPSLLGTSILGNFSVKEKNEDKCNLILEIPPIEWRTPVQRMYGGSIAANTLLAGAQLARPEQHAMTMQVDYLAPGDYSQVQRFEVSCLRSTKRFTHVSVLLRQNDSIVASGKASFHVQEDGAAVPSTVTFPENCPMPNELDSGVELWNGLLETGNDKTTLGRHVYNFWCAGVRFFGMQSLYAAAKCTQNSVSLCHWIRFRNDEIYDLMPKFGLHWSVALLTWASDFHPMFTVVSQQPDYGGTNTVCSLAHAMWFSTDPEVKLKKPTEEWFLHETVILMTGNNIGVCEGRLWTKDKKLLAVVKHHGLSRPKL